MKTNEYTEGNVCVDHINESGYIILQEIKVMDTEDKLTNNYWIMLYQYYDYNNYGWHKCGKSGTLQKAVKRLELIESGQINPWG